MNVLEFVITVRQDLRYAVRGLYESLSFTLVAVLLLALGVGAITAMFSVVNAVLVRPLPYPESDHLVRLARFTNQDAVTMLEYTFWKEHSKAYSSMAGYRGVTDRHLVVGRDQEWIKTLTVGTDFLRTLGSSTALGREFNAQEVRATGPPAIMISYRIWQDIFHNDPDILGRVVKLDKATYSIVGVLSRDFWFPQAADALVALQSSGGVEDTGTNTSVIARLQNGVTLKQAQAENTNVTENLRHVYGTRVSARYKGLATVSYQDWLVGNVRQNLLLLFGTTGFLFLMVCANLSSLFLVRLAGREKEIAIRMALGSNSSRILQQFVIENILLTSIGILAGLLVAQGMLSGLLALIPFHLPTAVHIGLDRTVLLFAIGILGVLALIFTIAPTLNASRLKVHEALKAVGQIAGTGAAHQRVRHVLVTGQIAVSAMLLVSAGLLIQSLYRLHLEPLGFSPHGLITFTTSLAPDRYPDTLSTWNFANNILTRVGTLPGVRDIAAINVLPLTGGANLPSEHEGYPDHSIGGTEIRLVTPDYFRVMGIPLRQGRSLTMDDSAGTTPVVIINDALAHQWWPQGSPLGDRVIVGRFQGKEYPEILDLPREVVGIAGDTKTVNLKEPPKPTLFIPIAQAKNVFVNMTGKLVWIAGVDSRAGIPKQIRTIITELDREQNIQELRGMEDVVATTMATSRFDAWLFGTFAALALALSGIGVYGLLSFSVACRRQEIGTRMALGATRAGILRLFLKQGLVLTAIGLALGIVGALFLGRFVASLLYGIKPNDPVSFCLVSFLLLLAGIVASYIPSARATKIDPTVAMRYE